MSWKAQECESSVFHQVPAVPTSQGLLHLPDREKRSQSCFTQWSEGDADRDPEKVLDSQGAQSSEIDHPPLCRLQAA